MPKQDKPSLDSRIRRMSRLAKNVDKWVAPYITTAKHFRKFWATVKREWRASDAARVAEEEPARQGGIEEGVELGINYGVNWKRYHKV